jgi:uncharacterized membrane protein (UPF0127 family)
VALIPRLLLPLFAGFCATATAGESCHLTPAYRQMEKRDIVLHLPSGATRRLTALVADDSVERAGGFQHICVRDFARHPILFLFEGAVHSAFHMHNVHGPLDIAFLDAAGGVMEIQRMKPYAPGAAAVYYRPARPFSAALETESGLLSDLKPVRVESSRE